MAIKVFEFIVFSIISIAMMVYIFIDNRKNSPFDDSNISFDTDAIHKKIRSFIRNNEEQIISILGIKHVEELIKQSKPSCGFCFLTDKAYYFIGDIYQKKGLIHWKSNIQHRIKADDMKGIKVGKLYSLKLLLFICYMLFRFIYLIRTLRAILEEDYDKAGWLLDIKIDFIQICFKLFLLVGLFILFWALIYGILNFFLLPRTLISIEFTSHTLSFPVYTLGAEEIKAFYAASNNLQVLPSLQEKSKADSLMELSKLYEKEMISQEEFERLKKEIMEHK